MSLRRIIVRCALVCEMSAGRVVERTDQNVTAPPSAMPELVVLPKFMSDQHV
jgi:hypothetical protein